MELMPIDPNPLHRLEAKKKADLQKPTPASKKDRVELSENYNDKLKRVRARVKSGFYTSLEVRLDLSEKISKVLDQMTG